MRLDKLLADMNLGTRKDLKQEIRRGEVLVNGAPVKDPGFSVDGSEEILWKGKRVRYAAYAERALKALDAMDLLLEPAR